MTHALAAFPDEWADHSVAGASANFIDAAQRVDRAMHELRVAVANLELALAAQRTGDRPTIA